MSSFLVLNAALAFSPTFATSTSAPGFTISTVFGFVFFKFIPTTSQLVNGRVVPFLTTPVQLKS